MTEQEWLACTDPGPMLLFLDNRRSSRKFRLFAVACCRRIWSLMPEQRSRQIVEVAERYADDVADSEDLEEAWDAASVDLDGVDNATEAAAYAAVDTDEEAAACSAADFAADAADEVSFFSPLPRERCWGTGGVAERAAQAELLRCIFGNPFRPVDLSPSWVTPAVTGLADTIYQERAFDLLPVLADALEEAGCDNAEILHHSRSKTSHARGCWIVDLLLTRNE
jgi:hypothetical protein